MTPCSDWVARWIATWPRRPSREGLTPLLARILRNIGDAESQRQLGHALGVGPAQISVATSELVRRKLVERKADPEDHRLRRPQLTAKGRAAVARIEARTAASSPVAQALDEKQMRSLLKTLERIDARQPVASPAKGSSPPAGRSTRWLMKPGRPGPVFAGRARPSTWC